MSSPEHSSFLCRSNGSRAQHSHNFARPPAAPRPLRRRTAGSPQRPPTGFRRKSHLRFDAAALGGGERPRRGCGVCDLQRRRGGRQGQGWPGASIREACAKNRVSPTWGVSKNVGITNNMSISAHFFIFFIFFFTKHEHHSSTSNDHTATC